jgi:hypothetical protein
MKKVFEAFAKHKNAGANTFKFLFDGVRINDTETADTVRCACGGGGGGGGPRLLSCLPPCCSPRLLCPRSSHSPPNPPFLLLCSSTWRTRRRSTPSWSRWGGARWGARRGRRRRGTGQAAPAPGRHKEEMRRGGGGGGWLRGSLDAAAPQLFSDHHPPGPPSQQAQTTGHALFLSEGVQPTRAHHHARFARPGSAPTESPSRSLSVPSSARRRRR